MQAHEVGLDPRTTLKTYPSLNERFGPDVSYSVRSSGLSHPVVTAPEVRLLEEGEFLAPGSKRREQQFSAIEPGSSASLDRLGFCWRVVWACWIQDPFTP